MKQQKMSLANIQGKLSRAEMKSAIADGGKTTVGCSQAGDFCGRSSNGYTYSCCAEDRTKCVSEKCE
jgi:hypothetical protein